MANLRDTVVLDPQRFNAKTRLWNVPILTVRNLHAEELHINGELISPNNYTIKDNTISLNEQYSINKSTGAHLIISYNTQNISVAFWAPILVAAIGFMGTIGQPLLYNLKLLYQPETKYQVTTWGYDTSNHRFEARVLIDNLVASEKSSWTIYLAVRERNNAIDPKNATYKFISGPFTMDTDMEIAAPTDEEFTKLILTNKSWVQGVVMKIHKSIRIKTPFVPNNHADDRLVIVQSPSEKK